MPKFRTSHLRKKKSSIGYVFRLLVIIMALMAVIMWGSREYMNLDAEKETFSKQEIYYSDKEIPDRDRFYIDEADRSFLPSSPWNAVHHRYYSLAYNEAVEQSMWVSYVLTKESIKVPNVERSNWYMQDGLISTGSATYYDFKHQDFTRGHLAPAGDMAFNNLAMKESFLLSNMSPQLRNFNDGVWNELEQSVRDWAYERGEIIVVTGPVFYDGDVKLIGANEVAVPHAFYKALLDKEEKTSIAFVIPHEVTDLPLSSFAIDVNELEHLTGIDFFDKCYLSDREEEEIESRFDIKQWPYKPGRYKARVEKWNKD